MYKKLCTLTNQNTISGLLCILSAWTIFGTSLILKSVKGLFISARRMLYSGVDVFRKFFQHHSSLLQPQAMARRTSDAGVEECKGFSPPNDHTTSASSTPLPLGSWNLNTGTRFTESERSAGARCTLRTSLLLVALCVRFVALRNAETRRAWQQQ